MSRTIALRVQNLSKQYRLGEIGTGTLSKDLNRWWAKTIGKEDPYLKVGEVNDRASYGQSEFVWALRDIQFEVETGEVLGIIGKNGAGKSTLLKILSKVTGPTTGQIMAKGRIAALLEVGTGFHPELTGRENVFLNGTILGMTRKEVDRKLDEIVDFAGVARYLDTPVKRYSSGMKVRLGFAVAAHLEPEILIVDEVLAVGDAEFQRKAIGKMQEVSSEGGRTVLFVSHNMGSIQRLCSKVMLLKDGALEYLGRVEEGISRYLEGSRQNEPGADLFINKSKEIYIESIDLVDSHNRKMESLVSGEEARIQIGYKNFDNIEIDLTIRLAILDSHGEEVSIINNYNTIGAIHDLKQSGHITCVIPKLPLREGVYRLGVKGFNHRKLLFQTEGFMDLTVLPGDFYGTGRMPSSKSLFHIDNTWILD